MMHKQYSVFDDPWGNGGEWRHEPVSVPVTHALDAPLPYPHYTDERWNRAQLIYGRACKTDECNYSDRLWQWDYDAAERASETCRAAQIQPNTARWVEAWLSALHGKPVLVRYIMAGTNTASGYPYCVYGYDYIAE